MDVYYMSLCYDIKLFLNLRLIHYVTTSWIHVNAWLKTHVLCDDIRLLLLSIGMWVATRPYVCVMTHSYESIQDTRVMRRYNASSHLSARHESWTVVTSCTNQELTHIACTYGVVIKWMIHGLTCLRLSETWVKNTCITYRVAKIHRMP